MYNAHEISLSHLYLLWSPALAIAGVKTIIFYRGFLKAASPSSIVDILETFKFT